LGSLASKYTPYCVVIRANIILLERKGSVHVAYYLLQGLHVGVFAFDTRRIPFISRAKPEGVTDAQRIEVVRLPFWVMVSFAILV